MTSWEKKVSDSFCVLPWVHSFVNSNGNYQVCCTSEEFHKGIPDENGKFFNIKNQPNPEKVMNSEFMKNLRTSMLKGNFNQLCSRCILDEHNGGMSRRQIENKEHANILNELIANTAQDGQIKVEFKVIDYRLGNICNLECRMCGPASSSRWLKDWNAVKPIDEQISNALRQEYENFTWIEKDYLLTEFKEKLKYVERLHFAGGEPLITPQMAQMLKFCVDMDVAKNIIVTYNTNLTKLPPAILELWKEFKGIRLLCSIDGYDKTNDYIRYPSQWSTIDKHLSFLDEHFHDYKIQEIILACTVQIYNVLQLEELYDYLKKFKNVVPALNLTNLFTPFYLKTSVLPASAKQLAQERLTRVKANLEKNVSADYLYLVHDIQQIISFMNYDEQSSSLPLFLKVNDNIDKLKNVSLKDYLPELHKIIVDNVK